MYEEKARENQIIGGGDKKSGSTILPNPININSVDTRKELAKVAGVSEGTYTKGVKILNSDNEEVKKQILSGLLAN
ncbi:MAG: hypothetical protein VB100_14425 [Angelakisella sp.]|nr:hypothetical protein [Angelakisella sp.]